MLGGVVLDETIKLSKLRVTTGVTSIATYRGFVYDCFVYKLLLFTLIKISQNSICIHIKGILVILQYFVKDVYI